MTTIDATDPTPDQTPTATRPTPPDSHVVWKELDLDALEVTATWQKERFDQRFVNRMVNNFREELVGALAVAVDSQGHNQVWDGQHRLALLRTLGFDKWMCQIVHADTREQAELFVAQAQRKGLTGSNKHAARVFTDQNARDIDGIVRNHGFVLTPGHPNTILAVSTIYAIYDRAGGKVLDRTLNISKNAWPTERSGRTDIVLDGIATFLSAYDGMVNDQFVTDLLAKITDPPAFVAAAYRMCPTIKDTGVNRPARKYESVALYLAKEYGRAHNTKLHSKRILDVNRSRKSVTASL